MRTTSTHLSKDSSRARPSGGWPPWPAGSTARASARVRRPRLRPGPRLRPAAAARTSVPGRGFGGGPRGASVPAATSVPAARRARRGDVRSAILGLLAEGPSNGYGLIKAIAEKTDGAWKPSPGSVYPTLAQLVDEGLVAKEDGPRGAYSLTEEGTAHVTEHREAIDAALDNAREGGSGSELRDAARKLHGQPPAVPRRERRAAVPRQGQGRPAPPRAVRHPRRVMPARRRPAHVRG